MARPERFELPTTWFVARYSIQLSYGRVERILTGRRWNGAPFPKIAVSAARGRPRIPPLMFCWFSVSPNE